MLLISEFLFKNHLTFCHPACFWEAEGSFNNDAIQQISLCCGWSMRLWQQFISSIGLDSPGVGLRSQPHGLHINLLRYGTLFKPEKSNLIIYLVSFYVNVSVIGLCLMSWVIKTSIWWRGCDSCQNENLWLCWPVLGMNPSEKLSFNCDEGSHKEQYRENESS